MTTPSQGRTARDLSRPRQSDGRTARWVTSCALLSAVVCAPSLARAQDAKVEPIDAVPGSPRPPGIGLSPEAPPVPPAPGGRAPSFGAPTPNNEWAFGFTGRFSAWEGIGIGSRPTNPPPGYEGTALHVPPNTQGKLPYYAGAGLTLNFSYGNPRVTANVSLYSSLNGIERRGRHSPGVGPDIGMAYIAWTPEPFGALRLQIKAGAFREIYGGPGQWGWGIFGPLIGIKGYGESVTADYPLTPTLQLSLGHGVSVTPQYPEAYVRGGDFGWTETGRSTWVQHAHAGVSYQNQYVFKLHYANANGTDERTYLADDAGTPEVVETAQDGRMDAYAAEARWVADPYGQLGVGVAYWDFLNGNAVHDGIFWGIDWTAGGREMISKFIGPESDGDGQLAAVSAEYGLSVSRVLWYPRSFDGRAPDLRIKVAGLLHWTVATDDPAFEGATGYMLGAEVEYQMLSWFAASLRSYGENRDSSSGRWAAYSVTPGLIFRSDWQSQDRIEVAYTRMFYSSLVDNNSAAPLDRDLVMLGGIVNF